MRGDLRSREIVTLFVWTGQGDRLQRKLGLFKVCYRMCAACIGAVILLLTKTRDTQQSRGALAHFFVYHSDCSLYLGF